MSVPHPTLPLLATAHSKSVTIFSLTTFSPHSSLTGGHSRSIRSVAWKPGLPPHKLCLLTASFDATAGLWRWNGPPPLASPSGKEEALAEVEAEDGDQDGDQDWEFTIVLEGHDSEIKSCLFSPSAAYLATCSRDKSVWIWEDIGASEDDDEWETIAVLNEHEGDVKSVAWCPDVPGRNSRRRYSSDLLASASYDNTIRLWRQDDDAEWVCVSVLQGHTGTVWALQWEPRPVGDRFPRLLTCSADATIRIWALNSDDDDGDAGAGAEKLPNGAYNKALGTIPNTMRRTLREDWHCLAVLPKAHFRDIYAVAWSPISGIIASTGCDGTIALYRESSSCSSADAALEDEKSAAFWQLLATLPNAHGPYEINHITWSRRFDVANPTGHEAEMLITTGDDGVIRTWEVSLDTQA